MQNQLNYNNFTHKNYYDYFIIKMMFSPVRLFIKIAKNIIM